MTFLEKFQKEHPELKVESWKDMPARYFADNAKCPMWIGYETEEEGIEACKTHNCLNCWMRKIPNTHEVKEVKEVKDDSEQVIVFLTKSQCKSLADFIDFELMETIRKDKEIDSMDWLVDMCNAYVELKKISDQ